MSNEAYELYDILKVENLKELVEKTAENFGEKPAFKFERKKEMISVSYARFKKETELFISVLHDMNIINKKIAVIGENSYEWILTFFAAVNGGNIIVPIDRELPAKEVKNLMEDSGAEVFVFSDDFSDIAEYLKEDVKHFINMKEIPRLLENASGIINEVKIDNRALAALFYTSGTTGTSKGVMLSHFSMLSSARGTGQLVKTNERNLLVLPLHHSFGWNCGVLLMMLQGVETAINSSLKNVMADIEKFKPRAMFLVPLFVETFYKKISAAGNTDGFGDLELIVSGGAPIDAKFVKGLRDFGIHVANGYGITECSPVVSVNRNKHYVDGSIGMVLPCCKVKINNGEILVKGDNVMLGYYNREQATKDAFYDGWFRTGDIGHLDGEFLFISGRAKNVIILKNGKNVYPEDIEGELSKILYIKEAIVYAENDLITAEVFLDTENHPGCAAQLDADILKINKSIPSYKNIGKTVIRDTEFPKTTTKKIKRH